LFTFPSDKHDVALSKTQERLKITIERKHGGEKKYFYQNFPKLSSTRISTNPERH